MKKIIKSGYRMTTGDGTTWTCDYIYDLDHPVLEGKPERADGVAAAIEYLYKKGKPIDMAYIDFWKTTNWRTI